MTLQTTVSSAWETAGYGLFLTLLAHAVGWRCGAPGDRGKPGPRASFAGSHG